LLEATVGGIYTSSRFLWVFTLALLLLFSPGLAQDEEDLDYSEDQSDYCQFLRDNPGVHQVDIHELGEVSTSQNGYILRARKITTSREVRRYVTIRRDGDWTTFFISEDEFDPIISFFEGLWSKVEAKEEFPQETHLLYRCKSGISLGARYDGGRWKFLFVRPSGSEKWLRQGNIREFREKTIEAKTKMGV